MRTRNAGFTLVEILIVVAIIGVLAAIAVPNFIRFQARSKQAEAKTNLRAVFVGQRAIFSEQGRYASLIGDLGFAPNRGNRYYYDIGEPGSPGTPCSGGESRSTAIATLTNPLCAVHADSLRYGPSYAGGVLNSSAALPGAGTVSWSVAAVGVAPPASHWGVFGVCPQCSFSASAIGQVDLDDGFDFFTVSSEFTSMATATCAEQVPQNQPGSALNVRNDVGCD